VMINGKPKREHYRSFNMKTLADGEIDDYRSLRETLLRRLRYLADDQKTAIARFAADGVTIGKAKKGEQKDLETFIATEDRLSTDNIDYRNFLVARHEEKVIACASIFKHQGNILELKSVCTSKEFRGRNLGRLLARILLSKQKQKIYIIIDSALEDYYADIGFRHVREGPNVLVEKEEKFQKNHPEHPLGLIFVFEPLKQKPDISFSDRPNLLLIDGGKGQLSTIIEVLKELSLDIPVASLAKREEELFIPSEPLPLPVPKDSPARFLLQRLRDEAHRFANDRRKRRQKTAMFHSKLDDVPGIGEVLKTKLRKQFGSADFVIAASDEELSTILNSSQLLELRKLFPRPIP